MSCKCSKFDADDGIWECSVTGDRCMYFIPSSKQCAEDYQEGPDVDKLVLCNECIHTEKDDNDGPRFCTHEGGRRAGDFVEDWRVVCECFSRT